MESISAEMLYLIYKRAKLRIWSSAILCALCSVILIGVSPSSFQAKALFKEANDMKESPAMNAMRQMMEFSGYREKEATTSSILSSRSCLSIVIHELGMQAVEHRSLYEKFLWHVGLQPKQEPLRVKDVHYAGEKPRDVVIKPISSTLYEIDGTLAKYGSRIKLTDGSTFTLLSEITEKKTVRFLPFEKVMQKSIASLKVSRRKKETQMLDIAFSYPDPYLAKEFLNRLMAVYKEYLREDFAQNAKAQINYLEKRQNEIAAVFDMHLENYASYLAENIGDEGFMNVSSEMAFAKEKKKRFSERILELEVHSQQIASEDLFALAEKRRALSLKKHALAKTKAPRSLSKPSQEMPLISMPFIFDKVKNHKMPLPPRGGVAELEKMRLANIRHEISQLSSSDKKLYSAQLRKLKLEEYLTHERWVHNAPFTDAFEGLDLETAKLFYEQMQESIHKKEEEISKLSYLKDVMTTHPNFELSAFWGVLSDPIGAEHIKRCSEIMDQLRDESNLMLKDIARLQESLEKEKRSLFEHVAHQYEIAQRDLSLAREKLEKLNAATFDLINQEIFLLDEQTDALRAEKLSAYEREKKLLQEMQLEQKDQMKNVPEKWLRENKLSMRADMIMSLMEGMSQLVESKNVEAHLRQFESKAIDSAYIPMSHHNVLLASLGTLGAFLGGVLSLGITMLRKIHSGLPAPRSYLLEKGVRMPTDLRALFSELQGAQLIGVFANKDLHFQLQKRYEQIGKRAVILSFDPSQASKRKAGWMNMLAQESTALPPPTKQGILPSGPFDPYVYERLSTSAFTALKEKLVKSYDVIIFHTPDDPSSSEVQCIGAKCSACIFPMQKQTQPTLLRWLKEDIVLINF